MHRNPSTRAAPAGLVSWLEHELRIAALTEPIRGALRQLEHYTDLRGQQHPLGEMSAAEACLVIALLERHATTLHRGELAEYLRRPYPHSRSQELVDEAHRELARMSAAEWLRATPLYRALKQRASQ